MKIYTHRNLDIDAASAVSLFLLIGNHRISSVKFVEADFDGNEMLSEDIAIDIFAGGRGIKGAESAFSEILDLYGDRSYIDCFNNLSRFIDAHDLSGRWTNGFNILGEDIIKIPTILTCFEAMKTSYNDDLTLLLSWRAVIQGIYKKYKKNIEAKKETKLATFPYPNIAIIREPAYRETVNNLFRKGTVDFVIYSSGNNLGVIRRNNLNINLGQFLKEDLSDWFHHSTGFISCWGSEKAKKSTPANISPEELADKVAVIWNKFKE